MFVMLATQENITAAAPAGPEGRWNVAGGVSHRIRKDASAPEGRRTGMFPSSYAATCSTTAPLAC
jgi:hypothetical protein